MKTSANRRAGRGGVFVRSGFALYLSILAGCVAYHNPAELPPEKLHAIRTTPLAKLRVGIVDDGASIKSEGIPTRTDLMHYGEFPAEQYRARLSEVVSLLTASKLFKEVGSTQTLSAPPDILVRVVIVPRHSVIEVNEGSIVIPTLGIVPYNLGYAIDAQFEFLRVDRSRTTTLGYATAEKAWWGSLTSFLALSPNWTINTPDRERHAQHLALAITERADDILALAK